MKQIIDINADQIRVGLDGRRWWFRMLRTIPPACCCYVYDHEGD